MGNRKRGENGPEVAEVGFGYMVPRLTTARSTTIQQLAPSTGLPISESLISTPPMPTAGEITK